MITRRHNEHWPQGYVTIFCANATEDRLSLFFGSLQETKAALVDMVWGDIQYVCFNTLDFDAVSAILGSRVWEEQRKHGRSPPET